MTAKEVRDRILIDYARYCITQISKVFVHATNGSKRSVERLVAEGSYKGISAVAGIRKLLSCLLSIVSNGSKGLIKFGVVRLQLIQAILLRVLIGPAFEFLLLFGSPLAPLLLIFREYRRSL